MNDGYEFCPYCYKSTWIKCNGYNKESVGGVVMGTSTKEGKCKHCGRKMYIVEVKAIEEVASDV
jgi:hypothetical protein